MITHSHRELELLSVLRRLGGSARNADLAKALDVSEETVRRAVKALSKSGAVARVHGGAYLVGAQGDPSFFRRIAQHEDEKRKIAVAVAEHVEDGMCLFLDVGTTTAFVAEELRGYARLTIATNSIGVAQALVNHNGNSVHLLGGEMQQDERGTFGSLTEAQARGFAYDLALLSADGLSSSHGFLYVNASEAQLGTVVGQCSDKVLIALDHFKFEKRAPYRGLTLDEVDFLVTDVPPTGDLSHRIASAGVEIDIASRDLNEAQND
ncbi:DeoR/GlpR family DNA-binding transcription regulator [Roseibium sp. SCP14]|uniref:DeoR/GlpR family DNA-binding transcription regulator n=1 Tax=Roseibium sp. SCP14 TaxID=3141375 RepID=UPI00333D5E68